MHSKSIAYFVPRLPPGLVIFQNYLFCFFLFFLPYPPSASPFLPSETGWHFAGVITGRHSHLSPVGNLPFFPFPFPLSLSFLSFRHHQERERGKGKEERGRLPTEESCEQWLVMKPTKCCPVLPPMRDSKSSGSLVVVDIATATDNGINEAVERRRAAPGHRSGGGGRWGHVSGRDLSRFGSFRNKAIVLLRRQKWRSSWIPKMGMVGVRGGLGVWWVGQSCFRNDNHHHQYKSHSYLPPPPITTQLQPNPKPRKGHSWKNLKKQNQEISKETQTPEWFWVAFNIV